MYSKSEVMRTANAYAKHMSRSAALCTAWREHKALQYQKMVSAISCDRKANTERSSRMINATDIHTGDILYIEYGMENNWVLCKVTGTPELGRSYLQIAAQTLGSLMGTTSGLSSFECCIRSNSRIHKYTPAQDVVVELPAPDIQHPLAA